MDEKLKKAIFENEELLDYFLAVHLDNYNINNKITTEEAEINQYKYRQGDFSGDFNGATTYDIDYYISTIKKWKNSNAIDLLEEAIRKEPNKYSDAELEEAREKYELLADAQKGLYKEQVDFLKKHINKTFINKAYYVACGVVRNFCYFFAVDLQEYLYIIDKYKETNIATELRNNLKDIIEEKEVDANNEEIIKERSKEENFNYNSFVHNIETGIALSELVLNVSKNGAGTKEMQDYYIEQYAKDKGDIMQELLEEYKTPADAIAELLLRIKNFLRLESLFNETGEELISLADTIARKYEEKEEILEDVDFNKRDDLATNNFIELEELTLDNKERTKDFKNEAVKKVISIFAIDEDTKALAEEPRKTKEELRKEKYLSFNDLEPVSNSWNKVNVSAPHSALMDAHYKIASYNENNLELKENNLKAIKHKIERLEAEDTLTDAELENLTILYDKEEDAEKDLQETTKRIEQLDAEIKDLEEEIKSASKELLDLEETGLTTRELRKEKLVLKRRVKNLITNLEMKKKAKNSRGLYLQLAQDEGELYLTTKEEFTGGDLTLYLDRNIGDLTHLTKEATKLLRYLQGKAYNLDFKKWKNEDLLFFIDLDDYIEETGRSKNSYKTIRNQLEEAIELLQQEYFRINGKPKNYNFSITGKIEIIGDYFIIKPNEEKRNIKNNTSKTSFAFTLGHTYKQILFNDKVMQWASIPRLLNRLTDKEIKKKGYYNTKLEVVQELGYYLYETLRKNLTKAGYYKRTFKIKTIVDNLLKRGVLATNKTNTYSRRVIEPLEEALEYLEELGLITYETKAFAIYYGDEELGEAGLLGTKNEAVIKKAFEDAKITITFKVYDKETYDNILKKRNKKKSKPKADVKPLKYDNFIKEAEIIEN